MPTSIPPSLPTPKPAAYLRNDDGQARANSMLTSMVTPSAANYSADVSFVTPDYTPKEATEQSGQANKKPQSHPLVLSKEALALTRGGIIRSDAPFLVPRAAKATRPSGAPPSLPDIPKRNKSDGSNNSGGSSVRLNKFVRRLHDMLQAEKDSGIVEWRRGLLVLYSTDAFAKTILPKYFNTRNFKTFRRQLNYYGFVHVRSFSTTGSSTTALWVNRDLAKNGTANISSVLMLKRVEPCDLAKTAEGRRSRKESALCTVEEDIGVSAKSLQLEQIRSLALRADNDSLGQEPSAGQISNIITEFDSGTDTSVPSTDGISNASKEMDAPKTITSSASQCSSSSDDESTNAAHLLLMLSKASHHTQPHSNLLAKRC